jgi:hypothetical protein
MESDRAHIIKRYSGSLAVKSPVEFARHHFQNLN